MTETLPPALVAAFAEGVATTYWESYLLMQRDLPKEHEHLLIQVVNSLLERMQQRQCNAYEACSQLLLTLEHVASKRMAMAAAVVIVLGDYRAGTVLVELPEITT